MNSADKGRVWSILGAGLVAQWPIARRENDQELAVEVTAGLVGYSPIVRCRKTFVKPFENINYLKNPILVNSSCRPAEQESRNARFQARLPHRTELDIDGARSLTLADTLCVTNILLKKKNVVVDNPNPWLVLVTHVGGVNVPWMDDLHVPMCAECGLNYL